MSIKTAVDKSSMVQRYMVVEYHAKDRGNIKFDANGGFVNHFPLHHLMGEYHWQHLDAEHVIVTGLFHPHHKRALDSNPIVSVLPSLHASKAVSKGVKKAQHWHALKKHLEAEDTHNMSDIAELLEAKHGSLFSASR